MNDQLPLDENVSHSVTILIPSDAKISQPYWLVEPMNKGSYNVSDQTLIGKPENDPQSARSEIINQWTGINLYEFPFDINPMTR